MSRQELVRFLGRTSHKTSTRRTRRQPPSPRKEEERGLLSEPLTSDISKFWNGSSVSDDFFGEVRVPLVAAALAKRLGSFPFWRSEEPFLDAMEPIHIQASPLGMKVFLGEKGYFDDPYVRMEPS